MASKNKISMSLLAEELAEIASQFPDDYPELEKLLSLIHKTHNDIRRGIDSQEKREQRFREYGLFKAKGNSTLTDLPVYMRIEKSLRRQAAVLVIVEECGIKADKSTVEYVLATPVNNTDFLTASTAIASPRITKLGIKPKPLIDIQRGKRKLPHNKAVSRVAKLLSKDTDSIDEDCRLFSKEVITYPKVLAFLRANDCPIEFERDTTPLIK